MNEEQWIWICRWEDFQHYKPERDRAPAWIKNYTKQLDDDRYTSLPPRARALLHDVRIVFARCSYRVCTSNGTLAKRVMQRVYTSDLELLNHAGFIEIVSREILEQRLDLLYASRAPARSKDLEKEVEAEHPKGVSASSNRSEETPTPRAYPNGRAALDTDDIPLPRTEPRFDCPHCERVEPTWGDLQAHIALDHKCAAKGATP